VLIVTSEIFFWEKTEFRKRHIECTDGMAFTKNESIAMRAGGISGVDFEDTPIKSNEQIHAGKRAGKMGALRLVRHANEAKTNFACASFEVSGHFNCNSCMRLMLK
jgi:succinyl-CoA synthetase beta subunit